MTRDQMLNFLGEQIHSAGDCVAVAVKTGNKEKVNSALESLKLHIEFLKGYATALEHAGWLDKETADGLFAVFDGI